MGLIFVLMEWNWVGQMFLLVDQTLLSGRQPNKQEPPKPSNRSQNLKQKRQGTIDSKWYLSTLIHSPFIPGIS